MEHFLSLLQRYGITVAVDVRSYPFPKYAKQFDTDCLKKSLTEAKLKYLFLGRELGGMPKDESLYDADGHLMYDKVAALPSFVGGFQRLQRGLQNYNIALVCGEENPAGCHRRRLIAPALAKCNIELLHIRGDGRLETEADLVALETSDLDSVGIQQLKLFS